MNANKRQYFFYYGLAVAVGWISTAHPPWTAVDAQERRMHMHVQEQEQEQRILHNAGAKAARFALSF